MHDPKQEASVTIGGRSFTLAFTIGARRRLEAHYGKPLKAVFADAESDPDDIEFSVAGFWACLGRHQPSVTLDEVFAFVEDLGHAERLRMFDAVARAIACDTEQGARVAAELGHVPDPPKAGPNGAPRKRSASSSPPASTPPHSGI